MSIINWINNYRKSIKYDIQHVSLSDLDGWQFMNDTGEIIRKDNAFFSVRAIKSNQMIGNISELPIIDQAEIGILGFIICRDKYGLKILLQAKSEPGNTHITQIGPSVQATESNYKSKHNGKPQKYIDFFLNPQYTKLISLKQSEQGNRFLNKYNLNTIVEVDESKVIIEGDKYKWYYVNEINSSLNLDYLFNTDFKSVFTQLFEQFILENSESLDKNISPILNSYFRNVDSTISPILNSLYERRLKNKFDVSLLNLGLLKNWEINSNGITPNQEKSFGFHFFNISFSDREIPQWGQPLITKSSKELINLICHEKDDETLFVFKESIEIGFKNYLQLGPTHQYDVLNDSDIKSIKGDCIIQFLQSEEGGRFYRNISEYRVYKTDTIEEFENDEHYKILNLYQICQLLKIEGVFTNESRNIIASLISLLN